MSRKNKNKKHKNVKEKKRRSKVITPKSVIIPKSKKGSLTSSIFRGICFVWCFLRRRIKFGFVLSVIITVFGCVVDFPSFLGQTSVVPHESTLSTKLFDVPFTITNSSTFKIVNVRTDCRVLEATIGHFTLKDTIMRSNQHVLPNYLMPQQQMREKCSFLIRPSYSSEITSAYIEFQVGFEPSLIPWKYEMLNRFIFRMEHLPTGEQRWIPEPSYPDR